jgi:SAM-dependent methyltransferase
MTHIIGRLRVDPSNAKQAKAWDGDEGAYWAAHAEHFDRTVAAYHLPFLDAAEIGTGDRVLDIGCGTGQTTRAGRRPVGRDDRAGAAAGHGRRPGQCPVRAGGRADLPLR